MPETRLEHWLVDYFREAAWDIFDWDSFTSGLFAGYAFAMFEAEQNEFAPKPGDVRDPDLLFALLAMIKRDVARARERAQV